LVLPSWFTFLVPDHPGSTGQNSESHKTIVVVVVVSKLLNKNITHGTTASIQLSQLQLYMLP